MIGYLGFQISTCSCKFRLVTDSFQNALAGKEEYGLGVTFISLLSLPGRDGLDSSKKTRDISFIINSDVKSCRFARQAGHGHDFAADGHDEPGSRTQPYLTHRD